MQAEISGWKKFYGINLLILEMELIILIIDFHTHCFPDEIAKHAISSLEKSGNSRSFADGTLSDLLKTAHNANIDISVVQPIAVKPQNTPTVNSVAYQNNNIGGVISFGSVHPLYEDYKNELEKIKYEYKLKGIKIHPDFMAIDLNDPKMVELLSYAVKLNLIITIHAGLDISFPDHHRSTPKMLYDILPELKGGKIVMAHSGGYMYSEDVLKYLVDKDEVYIDTSYSLGYMDDKLLKKIYYSINPDHILFGTDSPWTDRKDAVQKIHSFGFSDDLKDKIFYKNAMKLLEI